MPVRQANRAFVDQTIQMTRWCLRIICVNMCVGVDWWQRSDFATFETSLINNFMMMFGNFPDDWAGLEFATPLKTELIIYVMLYFLVVFLLMQNFLLAIVVEAYMAVAEENQVRIRGQEFGRFC
jgi:hypothetical protein